MQRVVPPVAHLGAGIVRQRIAYRKAVDRHLDHFAKGAGRSPQGHVQVAGDLLAWRKLIIKELFHVISKRRAPRY